MRPSTLSGRLAGVHSARGSYQYIIWTDAFMNTAAAWVGWYQAISWANLLTIFGRNRSNLSAIQNLRHSDTTGGPMICTK